MSECAMTPKERRLERSIEIAKLEVYAAQTPEESRAALDKLRNLKDQRSPEILRMLEEQKGLRNA